MHKTINILNKDAKRLVKLPNVYVQWKTPTGNSFQDLALLSKESWKWEWISIKSTEELIDLAHKYPDRKALLACTTGMKWYSRAKLKNLKLWIDISGSSWKK